jgi:hypothetical protein
METATTLRSHSSGLAKTNEEFRASNGMACEVPGEMVCVIGRILSE